MRQMAMLQKQKSAYGGELMKTRKGRDHARPLATRNTIHLVLRSSRAKGEMSFRKPQNAQEIHRIVSKFAHKYGVKVISLANVGNHLHFHIKLGNLFTYKPFIRAITSAIAMHITGRTRWTTNKMKQAKFWDYRPFTRVIQSYKEYLNLTDYIQINKWEGQSYDRDSAQFLIRRARDVVAEMSERVRLVKSGSSKRKFGTPHAY